MASNYPTRDVEDLLFAEGARVVIGMDEVGRGAIAGPVAVGAAAMVVTAGEHPAKLRDSKLVSEKQRPLLVPLLDLWADGHAVGMASADEVEAHGITVALRLAGYRAYEQLVARLAAAGLTGPLGQGAVVLLDGSHNWLVGTLPGLPVSARVMVPVRTRVKADRDCVSVAAASIYAKVARDELMVELDALHSGYGWAGNKGYGAPVHYAGIAALGVVPGVHRTGWIH